MEAHKRFCDHLACISLIIYQKKTLSEDCLQTKLKYIYLRINFCSNYIKSNERAVIIMLYASKSKCFTVQATKLHVKWSYNSIYSSPNH